MDLIATAIPFFFVLIGIEVVFGRIKHRRIYRFNDSVNDLSLGILDQISNAFTAVVWFLGYSYLWQRFHILDMGADQPWSVAGIPWYVWVLCFVANDFMYYWAHRMSHEINIGWATHIAHHQSEEYNLTVALRQGAFQGFFFQIFYLPLAIVGFPPAVYGICGALNTIYQFWIHTRLIGKLGPIEWIMNTPSHHRVHHGRDPKYVDRNHAGVFIVWDRLFGTFQEEEEEPVYGIVTPLKSWNPVWGQVHYLVKLARTAWAAPRWIDKVQLWFRAPAWMPQGLETPADFVPESRRPGYRSYDARAPKGLHRYLYVQFALVLILTTGYLDADGGFTWPHRWAAFLSITASLVSFGAAFEGKPWGLPLEVLRVAALALQIALFGGAYYGWPALDRAIAPPLAIAWAAVSIAWFLCYRAHYRPRAAAAPEPAPTGLAA